MSAATYTVMPLTTSTFGATITDIRLSEISDATCDALHCTWLDYCLLIFPGQHLDRAQQIAFAKRFGALEFDYIPISNVRADGTVRFDEQRDDIVKVLKGNMGWHCDSTYMPVQAKGAVFSAQVVPKSGGQTGWADMRAAYDALDEATREQIGSLRAYHSFHYSQGKIGHVPKPGDEYSGYGFGVTEAPLRPLVKVHAQTGRKLLAIGRHAYGIPGMAEAESEQFLSSLMDFACQAPRVYHHQWTPGDVVVWDNRSLMHRACPWDMREPRIMHHSRIAGDPVAEYAAHA